MSPLESLAAQLVPPPRLITGVPGELRVPMAFLAGQTSNSPRRVAEAWQWLCSRLRGLGIKEHDPQAPQLQFGLTPEGPPGSYRIEVRPELQTLLVVGHDTPGLFAAIATLHQLLAAAEQRGGDLVLPGVVIEDHPLLAHRGYMLDVSRDRVPSTQELVVLIDQLSLLKYNELQLYVEHTFAYPGHEAVWRDSSPFTPQQIRTLDGYARSRGIRLIPNQNCLGHWHRWLIHPEYKDLAEVPEGVEHAFSLERQPFSLCPTDDRVLPLLTELFDAYLPCFTSGEFNVGLDETYDLGQGRSRAACEAQGTGRVYLEHLRAVHALVAGHGRRMQFWGDIIVNHPELVPELPRDAIANAWGYEAGHPFEEQGALFAQSGLQFQVCPGTSTWQALTGRLGNMQRNLEEAWQAARGSGARGYLVTDWGDYGHWQPAALSWPGMLLGASYAWSGRAPTADLETLLSRFFIPGHPSTHPLTQGLLELSRIAERTGCETINGTPFFFLLKFLHEPLEESRYPGLDVDALQAAQAELHHCARGFLDLPAGEVGIGYHSRELAWAADLARWTTIVGRARLEQGAPLPIQAIDRKTRQEWASRLDYLIGTYRDLWPLRSRPGGLEQSAGRLLISRDTLLRDHP